MIVHPSAIVLTAHIVAWADDRPDRQNWLADCLHRHNNHDWGDLNAEDWQMNDDQAHYSFGTMLSLYCVPPELLDGTELDEAVYVITDDLADPERVTTLLWTSEH